MASAFDAWLEDAGGDGARGCLLVDTAGELGRRELAAADAVDAATARLTAGFERAFDEARERGELREGLVPADLARLAVAAGDGALLRARAGGGEADARAAWRALTALLDR